MERDLGLALRFASRFVKERIQERKSGQDEHRKEDFLDLLLEFQGDQKAGEPAEIMEKDVNVLSNARVLSEVQAELNRVVGEKMSIEEEDIESPIFAGCCKGNIKAASSCTFIGTSQGHHNN
ncbi:hypothetical protein Sjap_017907 [Stephania japonica]|uniref:Uncharacterized protein n=1 Tax=Stephania japonica TaxID=461633 RepID=A0AAP0I710_9MAGN